MKLMNDIKPLANDGVEPHIQQACSDLELLENIRANYTLGKTTTHDEHVLTGLEQRYTQLGVEGINIADTTLDIMARAVSLAKSIYDVVVEYLKGIIDSLGYVRNVLEIQNKYYSKLMEFKQKVIYTDLADNYKPKTIRAVASFSELEVGLKYDKAFTQIHNRLNEYTNLNAKIMHSSRRRIIRVLEAKGKKEVAKKVDMLQIEMESAIDDYMVALKDADNIVYSKSITLTHDSFETNIIGRKAITLEKPSFKNIMDLIPLIIEPSSLTYGEDLSNLADGIIDAVKEIEEDKDNLDSFTKGSLQDLLNLIAVIRTTYNEAITYNQDLLGIISKSKILSL